MDERYIVKQYVEEFWTMRRIADSLGTNHHTIKRILVKHNVVFNRKSRATIPFTEEHRRKIGEALKGRAGWNKGKKTTDRKLLYRNMQTHLAYNVTLDWLLQFEDFERIKFLNRSIARPRDRKGFTLKNYQAFIEKFYHNPKFLKIYQSWKTAGKPKWAAPSLDHMNPKSRNGSRVDLENLQFLTWFENRAKVDMTAEEWEIFKKETNTTSDLFI